MFVRRTLFAQLGGFPDEPMLGGVLFSRKRLHLVTPMLLAPSVIADSRKLFRWVSGAALPVALSSFFPATSIFRFSLVRSSA